MANSLELFQRIRDVQIVSSLGRWWAILSKHDLVLAVTLVLKVVVVVASASYHWRLSSRNGFGEEERSPVVAAGADI